MVSELLDPAIPLCFDTSAVFGTTSGPALLHSVRARYPKRELILPSWTVAERVRQLRQDLGHKFDPSVVRGFLRDPNLKLKLSEFSAEVALDSWVAVTAQLPGHWSWEGLPESRRPCAQRCRAGDYLVAAIAAFNDAILVTDDKALSAQMRTFLKGCISSQELRASLS